MRAPSSILTIVLALSGTASAAPDSLRDIVAKAITGNPDLLAAGADLDRAKANAVAASGVNDFIIDAQGAVREDKSALVTGVPVQSPEHRAASLQLGLTQPLPTGGTIGLRLVGDTSRDKFVQATETGTIDTSSTSYNPALELVFTHSLLKGFGPTAARGELRRARIDRDAAGYAREARAAAVLRDVAAAYWELRFAQEELEVEKQLASGAREQLAVVEANIKAGKMPSSASAEVKVTIGLRDEAVMLTERSVLERSLDLRTLSGMPIGAADNIIVAGDALDAPDVMVPLAQALQVADQSNQSLLSARLTGKSASVEVDVTENGLLPQLDLSLIAGPTGSAADAGEAFRQLSKFDSYTVQAQLTFRQPIGRHAARGAELAARAVLRRARLDEAAIAAQTRAAVVRVHALTEEAHRRLDVIAPTSEAAELDLSAEKARFEVGRSTNFDVLRRQDELAQTRLRMARARADLLIARAALWSATGEILDRFGVTVR